MICQQKPKGVILLWCKSDQAIERHPKTLDLMGHMGWCLDVTIGKLHRFWWWCMIYAEDGDLRKHSDIRLGVAVGLSGQEALKFVEAMRIAGWIDIEPYPRVHDWWDHIWPFLKMKYRQYPAKWQRIRDLYLAHGQKDSDEDIGEGKEEEPKALSKCPAKKEIDFMLPEWVPRKAWDAYIEMRKTIKKPLKTAYGAELAIKSLDKLRAEGNAPEAVLNQSVLNSWQGLFAIKKPGTQAPVGIPSQGKRPCSTCKSTKYGAMVDGMCKPCYDKFRNAM